MGIVTKLLGLEPTWTSLFLSVAATAALSAGAGWHFGAALEEAKALKHNAEQQALREVQAESARLRDHAAAAQYAATKEANRVRSAKVATEVANALQADPDCSRRALPPGLRDAVAAAEAGLAQPVPDGAVLDPGTASAGDVE